jgi:shikimate kinase
MLAEKMGVPFLDTDELIIAREGMSIRKIVESGGWNLFREKEKAAVHVLGDTQGSIVATGGGICDDPENRAVLRAAATLFWLTADAETIIGRMLNDCRGGELRPSLARTDVRDDVTVTLGKREPIYRQIADFIVDTSGKTIDAVVDEIYGIVKGGQ